MNLCFIGVCSTRITDTCLFSREDRSISRSSSLPRALHHRDNENVRAPRFLLRRPRRRVQGDQGPSACEFFVEIFFSLHPSCFLASSSSSSLVLVRLLPSATATSRMKWIRRRRFGRVRRRRSRRRIGRRRCGRNDASFAVRSARVERRAVGRPTESKSKTNPSARRSFRSDGGPAWVPMDLVVYAQTVVYYVCCVRALTRWIENIHIGARE